MTADFNGDGSFDGYDMQYLEGGGYHGDGGCDGCIKYGCAISFIVFLVMAVVLTILFEILAAICGYGN